MDWESSPTTMTLSCAVAMRPDDLGLDQVGILVFVHQDMAEAAGYLLAAPG